MNESVGWLVKREGGVHERSLWAIKGERRRLNVCERWTKGWVVDVANERGRGRWICSPPVKQTDL